MKPQTAVQRAMQAYFGATEHAPGAGFVTGFEAGWNAAVTHMIDILAAQEDKSAPAEAATSNRRSENIITSSIPYIPTGNQVKRSEILACESMHNILAVYRK